MGEAYDIKMVILTAYKIRLLCCLLDELLLVSLSHGPSFFMPLIFLPGILCLNCPGFCEVCSSGQQQITDDYLNLPVLRLFSLQCKGHFSWAENINLFVSYKLLCILTH